MAIIRNAKIGKDGRVTIPRAMREHLDLEPGDEVIFRMLPGSWKVGDRGGSVIMETPAQVRARILRGVLLPDENDVQRELVGVLQDQVNLSERRMRDLMGYLDNHAELAQMREQPLPAWITRIREIIGDHAHTAEPIDTTTEGEPS